MQSMTAPAHLEQLLLDHVEVLFSVATQLTHTCLEAEKLTRTTLCQVLRAPEMFEEISCPKRELLALLRRNYIQDQCEKSSMKMRRNWFVDSNVIIGDVNGAICAPSVSKVAHTARTI